MQVRQMSRVRERETVIWRERERKSESAMRACDHTTKTKDSDAKTKASDDKSRVFNEASGPVGALFVVRFWGRTANVNGAKCGPKLPGPKGRAVWEHILVRSQLASRPKLTQNWPRKPGPGTGSTIEQPKVFGTGDRKADFWPGSTIA